MKRLIVIVVCLHVGWAAADDYRYNLMASTGLQERVFDQEGKETTIVFSDESNPEARFLLTKILELGGISGTKGMGGVKRGGSGEA